MTSRHAVVHRAAPTTEADTGGLTSNALKVIAIVAMFFDHFCLVFVDTDPVVEACLRIPGRLAAPIMCFLIAEGSAHTSSLPRYALRLFLFALISHLPYDLYFGLDPLRWTSVIWSLFCGLVATSIVERRSLPVLVRIAAVLVCCVLAKQGDWGYVAVLWIVGFRFFRGRFAWQAASFALIGLCLYAIPGVLEYGPLEFYRFCVLLALPILAQYNGRLGRRSAITKYSFYIFYPGHLVVLLLLRMVMGI